MRAMFTNIIDDSVWKRPHNQCKPLFEPNYIDEKLDVIIEIFAKESSCDIKTRKVFNQRKDEYYRYFLARKQAKENRFGFELENLFGNIDTSELEKLNKKLELKASDEQAVKKAIEHIDIEAITFLLHYVSFSLKAFWLDKQKDSCVGSDKKRFSIFHSIFSLAISLDDEEWRNLNMDDAMLAQDPSEITTALVTSENEIWMRIFCSPQLMMSWVVLQEAIKIIEAKDMLPVTETERAILREMNFNIFEYMKSQVSGLTIEKYSLIIKKLNSKSELVSKLREALLSNDMNVQKKAYISLINWVIKEQSVIGESYLHHSMNYSIAFNDVVFDWSTKEIFSPQFEISDTGFISSVKTVSEKKINDEDKERNEYSYWEERRYGKVSNLLDIEIRVGENGRFADPTKIENFKNNNNKIDKEFLESF